MLIQDVMPNRLGQTLTEVYYRYSPPMAQVISGSSLLRTITRWVLMPVVGFCWIALNLGFMQAVILLILLAVLSAAAFSVPKRMLTRRSHVQ